MRHSTETAGQIGRQCAVVRLGVVTVVEADPQAVAASHHPDPADVTWWWWPYPVWDPIARRTWRCCGTAGVGGRGSECDSLYCSSS
eukprot:SAG25_NODE_615_length_6505_cov_8.659694_8_plen_86_part_00